MVERLAVGFGVGIFGFLIGLFAWWMLADEPGFRFGWRVYLYVSCALGIVSFFFGAWRPNTTIDALGLIGQKIWNFCDEVLDWFRLLR